MTSVAARGTPSASNTLHERYSSSCGAGVCEQRRCRGKRLRFVVAAGCSTGAAQSRQARIASAHDSGVRKPAMPASARSLSDVSACGARNDASGFAVAVGFDERLDRDLRLELRGAAGDREHEIAVVGREQRR